MTSIANPSLYEPEQNNSGCFQKAVSAAKKMGKWVVAPLASAGYSLATAGSLLSPASLGIGVLTGLGVYGYSKIRKSAEQGRTLLHIAASYGNLKLVRALVAAGADPFAQDQDNNSPLSIAAKRQDMAMMKVLTKTEDLFGPKTTIHDFFSQLFPPSDRLPENANEIVQEVAASPRFVELEREFQIWPGIGYRGMNLADMGRVLDTKQRQQKDPLSLKQIQETLWINPIARLIWFAANRNGKVALEYDSTLGPKEAEYDEINHAIRFNTAIEGDVNRIVPNLVLESMHAVQRDSVLKTNTASREDYAFRLCLVEQISLRGLNKSLDPNLAQIGWIPNRQEIAAHWNEKRNDPISPTEDYRKDWDIHCASDFIKANTPLVKERLLEWQEQARQR